jgi:murein DD-endopeptidase MepM/ murein hydrolase activator NlpD
MTEYNPGHPFKKSSNFGDRPDPFKRGKREFHTGIDFKAPIGTPIPAASDGKVVYSQFNKGGFGNTVIIESTGADGERYFTQYSHMVGPGAAFGTKVRAGEVIGQVGSTGRSQAPHVHFEVLRGNAGVNDRNDPKVNGIGFTTLDIDRRHDPTQFNNWAGGAPYNGLSGVASGAEAGQVPRPPPRPDMGLPDYRGAVPAFENPNARANTVDDNNWLASVLNPKPLTPNVSRLDTWPQPPYPPGAFYPQTPNGIVDYRFYDRSPASPGRAGQLSPGPLSPSIDQPGSDSPFNPYRLQPFPPQLLPQSTSGSATRASIPGDPNAEMPLARLLRLTAGGSATEPAGDTDPSADRVPARFADPLAALAALVRLSAMRDGPG